MSVKAYLAQLEAAGVTEIVYGYDGYGDEGRLELSTVTINGEVKEGLEAQGALCEVEGEDGDLSEALFDHMYQRLGREWPCWMDGEGATGTLILNVGSGTVHQEHGAKYIALEESEEDWPLDGDVR